MVRKDSSVARLTVGLWLVAKYGSKKKLKDLVKNRSPYWLNNDWVARQVAAVSPRLTARSQLWLRAEMVREGQFEGLKVLDHLRLLAEAKSLDAQMRSYLMPSNAYASRTYPFHKVLIAAAMIQRKSIAANQLSQIQAYVRAHSHDKIVHELIAG